MFNGLKGLPLGFKSFNCSRLLKTNFYLTFLKSLEYRTNIIPVVSSVVVASETMVRVDDLDAEIQMMLYTDHTYSEAYRSAPSIELRSKVCPHISTLSRTQRERVFFCFFFCLEMMVKLGTGVRGGEGHGARRLLPAAAQ